MSDELVQKAVELRNEGYSYQEIADELGLSKATVYRYVKKAQKNSEPETINESNDEPVKSDGKVAGETDSGASNTVDVTNINTLLENKQTSLKVQPINKVIDKVNNTITVVEEEVEKETEKKETSKVGKITKTLKNKWMLFVLIASFIVILAVLYMFFRNKEPEQYSEPKTSNKGCKNCNDEETIVRQEAGRREYVIL